jgi:hypothetical protein
VKAETYLRAGNRDASKAVMRTMDAIATTSGDPNMTGWLLAGEVVWALAEARYPEASETAQRAVSRIGLQVPNIAGVVVTGAIWTAYEQGNSALVLDTIKMIVAGTPHFHGMRAALAVHQCELGLLDDAREELAYLMENLAVIPRNVSFACTIGLMAEAAAQAGCAEYAPAILAELEPFRGEIIGLPANVFMGAAERYLGALRSTIGETEEAIADLKTAIAMEEAMGAEAWLIRSRRWLEKISAS